VVVNFVQVEVSLTLLGNLKIDVPFADDDGREQKYAKINVLFVSAGISHSIAKKICCTCYFAGGRVLPLCSYL
jgi:hypothetical protein